MLIKALELADPETREELWGWIEKKEFDHEEKIKGGDPGSTIVWVLKKLLSRRLINI